MKRKITALFSVLFVMFMFLNYPHNWNYPDPVKCKSCHEIHGGFPGQFLARVNGNINLCVSLCHNPSGSASHFVINYSDTAIPGTQGTSHNFDTQGDNTGYDANTSSASLPNYVENGKIVCSTCHEQHNHLTGKPFLVVDIDTVYTLCNDCHSPRDQSTPPYTSHPVNVQIPSDPNYTTPQHLPLYSGKAECTSCHNAHFSYSDTTYRGIAEGGSTESLVDNDASWMADQFVNWKIKFYPATSSDTASWFQIRTITSNTNNTIYWTGDPLLGTGITAGTPYVIMKPGTGDGYLLNQNMKDLCLECHTFSTNTGIYSSIHLDDTFGVRWPGGKYGSDYAYVEAGTNILPPARKSSAQDSSGIPLEVMIGGKWRGACINCHWPHGWPDGQGGKYPKLLVEEVATSDNPSANDEKLCLTCHDGNLTCNDCHDTHLQNKNTISNKPFIRGDHHNMLDIDSLLSGTMRHYDEGTNRPVNTHHDIRLSEFSFSGAKVPCVACHNPHKIGRDDPSTPRIREDLINPDNPSEIWQWNGTPNWGGDTDEEKTLTHFCLVCHDGNYPPTITPSSVPLRNIKRSWDPNDGQGPDDKMGPDGRDIPCTICHTVHGSYSKTQPYGHNEQTNGNLFMLADSVYPFSPNSFDYRQDNVYQNGKRTWVDSTSANNAVWNPKRQQFQTEQRVFFGNFCDVCHANKLDMQNQSCSADGCHHHGSGKF